MLLTLHSVFLGYLLIALAWNAVASARAAGGRGRWERRWFLPLLLVLAAVLVADRLRPSAVPLLDRPWIAALFPLAFGLAVAQNVHAVLGRGARLTDIPILLANVGLLICTALGTAELAGAALPAGAAALLYDHSILQHLLGSPLAHLSTLSWHVPLLVRREDPQGWAAVLAGLFVAALAGFIAVLLAGMLGTARGALQRFEDEPRVTTLRADLHVGVVRQGVVHGVPPGSIAVRCPIAADVAVADIELPAAARPFVVEVAASADWILAVPDGDTGPEACIAEAARLAAMAPDILLPFPEPDGVGALLFGVRSPAAWRALHERAAQAIHAVSPRTRVAVRLAGHGPASRDLFLALAAEPSPVDVAGPRLLPGPAELGGPAVADDVLAQWDQWRAELPHPPELWILAAGVSAPECGELAQARFVEGCLARASARPDVAGILIDGWTDAGHTLGLLRADGTPRVAGDVLRFLLAAPRAEPAR